MSKILKISKFFSIILLSSLPIFSYGSTKNEISPSHLAAAKEILNTSNFNKSMLDITYSMNKVYLDSLVIADPCKLPIRNVMEEHMNKYIKNFIKENETYIFDNAAMTYAKYFTEAELKEFTEFNKTETGKKALQILPSMMREFGDFYAKRYNDYMQKNFLKEEFQKAIKETIDKIPPEKLPKECQMEQKTDS